MAIQYNYDLSVMPQRGLPLKRFSLDRQEDPFLSTQDSYSHSKTESERSGSYHFTWLPVLLLMALVISMVRKKTFPQTYRRKNYARASNEFSRLSEVVHDIQNSCDSTRPIVTCPDYSNPLRSAFPYFNNSDNIYLDSAAATHKPLVVQEAVSDFYATKNANVHRGSVLHPASLLASNAYESARQTMARFILSKKDKIVDMRGEPVPVSFLKGLVITRGATHGINLVASAFRVLMDRKKKENGNTISGDDVTRGSVVVTEGDHHSNILPWGDNAVLVPLIYTSTSERKGWMLDMEVLEEAVTVRTQIISIIHSSHVTGAPIANLEEVKNIMLRKCPEALLMLDCSQSALHDEIDVRAIPADIFVFSGHKLLGPTGVGFMWLNEKARNSLRDPGYIGGGAVESVSISQKPVSNGRSCNNSIIEINGDILTESSSRQKGCQQIITDVELSDWPHRWESGTPPIAEAVGLSRALQFIIENRTEIASQEKKLLNVLYDGLNECIETVEHKMTEEPSYSIGTSKIGDTEVDRKNNDLRRTAGNRGNIKKRKIQIVKPYYPRNCPIVSVDTGFLNPGDVATLMAINSSVCVRAGTHCSGPLHRRLGVAEQGTLRFSIGPYNTLEEIIKAIDCFKSSVDTLLTSSRNE